MNVPFCPGDERGNPAGAADRSGPAPRAFARADLERPVADLCRLLSLLSDGTRLRILWLLAQGERAVGSITTELALPQPTVSHHLAWLRTMQLVAPRRAGKNVFYALGRAATSAGNGAMTVAAADATVILYAHGAG